MMRSRCFEHLSPEHLLQVSYQVRVRLLRRLSCMICTQKPSSKATTDAEAYFRVFSDYEALIDNLLVDNPSSNTASTNMVHSFDLAATLCKLTDIF